MLELLNNPITEDWLKSVGFKWHQCDRQPSKHWLLWLGGCMEQSWTCFEDLGIEVAPDNDGAWHCWLRSDSSHRYHRFIHVRHIKFQREIIALVKALTGLEWNPANHLYGSVRTQKQADHIRKEDQRLDRQWNIHGPKHHKWSEVEKDDTMSGALPEHLVAHEKAKK